jgi:propanol-preferring alcohol dehydrogenase
MKTMKAAVVKKFGKPLVIEEMPIPKIQPYEVLVKVIATGVCHTDLHAISGDWPVKPTVPFIPGHEGVGYVVKVGKGVKNLKEGDAVGVPWLHDACGHCEYCFTGWETLCEKQHNTGYGVNGSFAEYVVANADYVGILPQNVNFIEIAPILCAGVTVYKGLKETDTRPGEWVVISGIGGLGHVAVQYAKAMGLHVAAIDVFDDKLALAKSLGADIVINSSVKDAVAVLKKETGGMHGALVTSVSPKAFELAMQCLRRKGTLVLNGIPPGSFDLPIFDTVINRITVRGSIVGTRKDLQEAIDFAVEGKVKAIVKTAPLEDVNKVFDQMKKSQINGRMVLEIGNA